MNIFRMENQFMNYQWGSTTFIQELLGMEEYRGKPMAELWLGAHPKASSDIILNGQKKALMEYILKDPDKILGKTVSRSHNRCLPFLVKVLAAEKPLSIQAHPNADQAKEGFRHENRLKIPLDSSMRNYLDDNHKPELICALTPFTALCGFRPFGEMSSLFSELGIAEITPSSGSYFKNRNSSGLKSFFIELMTLSSQKITSIVKDINGKLAEKQRSIPNGESMAHWFKKLAKLYPGDPGVFAPLLLNLIQLEPGKAIYLASGILHAYLQGAGIEIMANSDNVLRGGLTKKKIDLGELSTILTFKGSTVKPIQSSSRDIMESVFYTPAAEFELSVLSIQSGRDYPDRKVNGPEILICTEGEGEIYIDAEGKRTIDFKKGESFFVAQPQGSYRLSGNAILYRSVVGGK